jgi:hypothetical protein
MFQRRLILPKEGSTPQSERRYTQADFDRAVAELVARRRAERAAVTEGFVEALTAASQERGGPRVWTNSRS